MGELKSKYEFWSFWLFYAPFVPIWLWFSLRARSLVYFCNANPGIEWGGFTQYSKYNILQQLDSALIPKTIYYKSQSIPKKAPMNFPFVAKPDLGERGKNVELIRNSSDWLEYIKNTKSNIFVQEFMQEPMEFGIFYVRLPSQNKGKILSITGKEFLTYFGNGKTSLKQFIVNNQRSKNRKEFLLKKFKDQLDLVLEANQSMILEEIGNHNRGTLFLDSSHLNSQKLEKSIHEVSKQIKGFFYGRYDVKANSVKDLQNGNIRVIEVNGSNSEATHVYDPKHSLLYAYKEVYRHLHWQYKIAKENKKSGHSWHSPFGLLKALLNLS